MLFAKLIVILALAFAFSDEGGLIDPNGGGAMDPNGGPRVSGRCSDEGSGLDPHGQPCPTALVTGDDGRGIDPNG